jgi:two-component system, NarL family, response regulator DegU
MLGLGVAGHDLSGGFEPVCKTLIVEDSVAFRQMLKESLRSRFPTMEIEEEPDGRDLFTKIDSFHPRIVFMDIRLPRENGLELTKKIKENYPDIIVVILTSHDLPEYRQAARENMADYFVLKGSSIQDFRRNSGRTGPG